MIKKIIRAISMIFRLVEFVIKTSKNVHRGKRHQRKEPESIEPNGSGTSEDQKGSSDKQNDPGSDSGDDHDEKVKMASVQNIYDHVFKWEGGLVYHKNEGQWTNMGIQWTTFKRLAKPLLNITNPTLNDLKTMTKGQAKKFINHFWNLATYYNRINNQDTANIFFTALWGSGGYGIKDLQRALNVDADGVVGPKTVAAANRANPKVLYSALENRYRRLAAADPQYKQYLKGWLNRLSELEPGKVAASGLLLAGGLTLALVLMNKI
jgi:hypothetical protein